MKKIIQITVNGGGHICALTEDGKIYLRKNGKTRHQWEEVKTFLPEK